ncbi:unnamed protein product [Cylindrotheca closterium]|uniref:Uncharacterized protein n=1 Tax=Cylindrotheca closterium TaxID=2856 RepID=A0AAD2G6A2_9STRA|nr:unnamed protein product [Cylindrotheca closterium]
MTNIKLPSTLREILLKAFSCCERLSSIDLPLGLTVIGMNAFENTSLRRLQCPATVEIIGRAAFTLCNHLKSIILPPRLEVIESEVFDGCDNLEEIEMPRTVRTIGNDAFAFCSALKKLDLSHCTQCLTFGDGAFFSCSGLSWIILPPNLEGLIQRRTFEDCSALTHIRVSPNVTSIGVSERCTSLLSLELPEGLETIKLFPFDEQFEAWEDVRDWSSLVNLYLPPSQNVSERLLNEPIPGDLQLAKVAQNWGDLVGILQHRFDRLPLHRVCYFHSYHHVEDTIKRINDILRDNPGAMVQTEMLSLLELKLWKMKLDENPMEEKFDKAQQEDSRQSCRVGCGISIVVEHVVLFLGKPASSSYSSNEEDEPAYR